MAAKKQKYYVVWQGREPGIYSSWEEASRQVKEFPGARYKSFGTLPEAEKAYSKPPSRKKSIFQKSPARGSGNKERVIIPSISVDAACSGNPGQMEYRGVRTSDKTELFHFGPVKNGTNNIGEFLAIVHALALMKKENDPVTPIYTDSKTALSWVKKKKAKTLLKADHSNEQLFELIKRAEKWLATNEWSNPLLKWETRQWGEIPADFGRK